MLHSYDLGRGVDSASTTASANFVSATIGADPTPAGSSGAAVVVSRSFSAAEEGTTLYRAVGDGELEDIQENGGYRVTPGGTQGKYFSESPEQASNFARMMGDQPYTTTSVRVSPGELANGHPINPSGEGPGYFFETPHVPSGPVSVFNHSVLP